MTTLNTRLAAPDAAIKTGVPLVIIFAAALTLGVDPACLMCMVMAAVASSTETFISYFWLLPRREDYRKRNAMASYYNNLASVSAACTAVAMAVVYWLWK